jgi:hypothetical protein
MRILPARTTSRSRTARRFAWRVAGRGSAGAGGYGLKPVSLYTVSMISLPIRDSFSLCTGRSALRSAA